MKTERDNETNNSFRLIGGFLPLPKLILSLVLLIANGVAYSEGLPTAIPMSEKGTATYYVTAQVGQETIELLVDTGAGYATLNRNVINKLKQTGDARHIGEIEGILANGDIYIFPVYKVSSFTLGGCILEDIEVAETPPNARNLLGLSVLRKAAPFTFSLEPAELQLSNCNPAASYVEAEDESYSDNHQTSGLSSLY